MTKNNINYINLKLCISGSIKLRDVLKRYAKRRHYIAKLYMRLEPNINSYYQYFTALCRNNRILYKKTENIRLILNSLSIIPIN